MGADTRLAPLSRLHGAAHPIVRLVGWGTRLMLKGWCASVEVRHMDRLLRVLYDKERVQRRQGVLTFANHISVLDDPTLFGALPADAFRRAMTTRWTLGASDIMFTNKPNAYIFRSGQVLPTDRGRGVFQPALDRSIELLENAGWVHVFPEGYVNMSRKARVRRFKWGVGRMLLEAGSSLSNRIGERETPLPVILPIWLTGFDAMMPEPRGQPRGIPRPGANITITFGNPINSAVDPLIRQMRTFATNQSNGDEMTVQKELKDAVAELATLSTHYPIPPSSVFSPTTPLTPPPNGVEWPHPIEQSRSANALDAGLDGQRARLARSFIAAELRAHLVKLGQESGVSLDLVHRLLQGEES